MTADRLQKALDAIDAFNRRDPRREKAGGRDHPAELLYSQRLTDWVLRLAPDASEALRAAARGQHIGRWTLPRSQYPMDRGGYLRWREALKAFHAQKVGEILQESGYDESFIGRVKSLILKKNIKQDPEAQVLEDALCLVFLETQYEDLRAKTPEDKMKEILKKSWNKMGPKGREAALKLDLSPDGKRLIEAALAG